jgi:hypothetical protein
VALYLLVENAGHLLEGRVDCRLLLAEEVQLLYGVAVSAVLDADAGFFQIADALLRELINTLKFSISFLLALSSAKSFSFFSIISSS